MSCATGRPSASRAGRKRTYSTASSQKRASTARIAARAGDPAVGRTPVGVDLERDSYPSAALAARGQDPAIFAVGDLADAPRWRVSREIARSAAAAPGSAPARAGSGPVVRRAGRRGASGAGDGRGRYRRLGRNFDLRFGNDDRRRLGLLARRAFLLLGALRLLAWWWRLRGRGRRRLVDVEGLQAFRRPAGRRGR